MLMERTEKSTNSMEMRIGLWFAATAHNSFNMIILQFYTIKKCMYFYSQYIVFAAHSIFPLYVANFHICRFCYAFPCVCVRESLCALSVR